MNHLEPRPRPRDSLADANPPDEGWHEKAPGPEQGRIVRRPRTGSNFAAFAKFVDVPLLVLCRLHCSKFATHYTRPAATVPSVAMRPSGAGTPADFSVPIRPDFLERRFGPTAVCPTVVTRCLVACWQKGERSAISDRLRPSVLQRFHQTHIAPLRPQGFDSSCRLPSGLHPVSIAVEFPR